MTLVVMGQAIRRDYSHTGSAKEKSLSLPPRPELVMTAWLVYPGNNGVG
jgi:hypothetical protein